MKEKIHFGIIAARIRHLTSTILYNTRSFCGLDLTGNPTKTHLSARAAYSMVECRKCKKSILKPGAKP